MTDDGLWVSEDHPTSGRTAVVEDAGDSVWLYLTEPGGARIVADCWLFNRVPAPDDVDAAAGTDAPPPAVAAVVGEGAHRPVPLDPAQVRFRWSADGESVAALVDGEPVGCIVAGRERGSSRHLRVAGPWGEPLDPALYQATFGDADG
jgi:hypothetical protein